MVMLKDQFWELPFYFCNFEHYLTAWCVFPVMPYFVLRHVLFLY